MSQLDLTINGDYDRDLGDIPLIKYGQLRNPEPNASFNGKIIELNGGIVQAQAMAMKRPEL